MPVRRRTQPPPDIARQSFIMYFILVAAYSNNQSSCRVIPSVYAEEARLSPRGAGVVAR